MGIDLSWFKDQLTQDYRTVIAHNIAQALGKNHLSISTGNRTQVLNIIKVLHELDYEKLSGLDRLITEYSGDKTMKESHIVAFCQGAQPTSTMATNPNHFHQHTAKNQQMVTHSKSFI